MNKYEKIGVFILAVTWVLSVFFMTLEFAQRDNYVKLRYENIQQKKIINAQDKELDYLRGSFICKGETK